MDLHFSIQLPIAEIDFAKHSALITCSNIRQKTNFERGGGCFIKPVPFKTIPQLNQPNEDINKQTHQQTYKGGNLKKFTEIIILSHEVGSLKE